MIPDLRKLTTESRNERSMELDRMDPLQIVELMNQEDFGVADAIKEVLPQIAVAITWCVESLKAEGRIIYTGAGTSGRIGLMDAVECVPTFGVSEEVVKGVIAGGEYAFVRAVEGAEDNFDMGIEDMQNIQLNCRDTVIGLSASGRTPYVSGALQYARKTGCRTVAIACNRNSEIGMEAEVAIEPVTGPEVLTGSTRLKAGTAQKMILNMISTASMVGIGKVYKNLMVDMRQSNEKLKVRAEFIVAYASGCSQEEAARRLQRAGGSVKTAIVMTLLDCGAGEAERRLSASDGHIGCALELPWLDHDGGR